MANYTAADIKALRERTGAGMMDVKKALDESDGDVDKAIEAIRIKGLKGAAKREGRSAAEGLITAKVTDQVGYLLEVNAETDFVAKSDKFIALADKVLEVAVVSGHNGVEALLEDEVDGKKLSDYVTEEAAILGEKVVVRRLTKITGGYVDAYLHKTAKDLPAQVGVLVAVADDSEEAKAAAHDVAVHAAAMSPSYLVRDEVPEEKVADERRIAEETARAENKPEQAISKIIEGRTNAYFKEHVLVDQPFAKDPKQSVSQILDAAGTKAVGFVRFRVGS
ncbi:translation elongation factor Ts [Nesterenkonia pannonica]|uniref:translation elongation factor Ts n=1 Tax=Nesterenkonia pannonica TaxID=1548602 RepID=UPI00216491D9|nr:translation elongation factor Ts [Nesterenkonia pannonica]